MATMSRGRLRDEGSRGQLGPQSTTSVMTHPVWRAQVVDVQEFEVCYKNFLFKHGRTNQSRCIGRLASLASHEASKIRRSLCKSGKPKRVRDHDHCNLKQVTLPAHSYASRLHILQIYSGQHLRIA